ncbi:MAG: hydroxyneurosporene methyltransferase, partial [Candidatus Dormibacteria bacterium]
MANTEQPLDLWTLSDLGTPWCIRVAVTLHIAEHIDAGITDIDGLAAVTSSDPVVLHSVLSYLSEKGIFVESPLGHFALNATSRGLLEAGMFLSLDGIGGRMTQVWSTLPTFV